MTGRARDAMKVCVIGKGYLAETVRLVCEEYGHELFTHSDDADIVWIAEDVSVSDDHKADVAAILDLAANLNLRDDAIVVLSSQVPLGTSARLQGMVPQEVVYAPENIRRGRGREDMVSHVVVLGIGPGAAAKRQTSLHGLFRWAKHILPMSWESAEMSKHAINAHLASQVALANEIGDLCAKHGANTADVEAAVRADGRCGEYLRVGEPFTGGTLARDLRYLADMGSELAGDIQRSNDRRLP